ncbi:hypothetical protein FBY04_11550 [Pseudomonas sp. SJZ080]|nr:hypothetical protein FBY04_11550 [Pseudomonas sp. SJZ080]
MRSIKPLDGLKPGRLREMVEAICHLPPEQWADTFGENSNFPRGRNGDGVHGFIQTQLELSRACRDKNIAAGELLDNDTWQTLRDFTQKARSYIREGTLDVILRTLEDFKHKRPSSKEAKALVAEFVAEFVKEIETPSSSNVRQRWPRSFSGVVRELGHRFNAIGKNHPQRSNLEMAVAPVALNALAVPVNGALDMLGSVPFKQVGDGLQNTIDSVASKADLFVFPPENVHPVARGAAPPPAESALLSSWKEIENKSSFYNEVVTTGSRVPNGLFAKFLYALNVLDTLGVMSVAEKVKPYLPAVPIQPPENATKQPLPPEPAPSVASMKTRVDQLETEVNDYIASLLPTPEAAAGSDIGVDPQPAAPSEPTSSATETSLLEQASQSVLDVLAAIDNVLTFPSAMAASGETSVLIGDPDALEMGPLNEVYEKLVAGNNDDASSTWWESLVPSLNRVVAQLTAQLANYGQSAVAAGPAALQLAKEHPVATSVATAVTALTALIYGISQLPATKTEADDFPSPEVESPALHQERIDHEVENILDAPVAKGQPSLSDVILERMYESPMRDLLNDKLLLHDVKQMLQQPCSLNPVKTCLELVEEALGKTHDHETSVQPPENNSKEDPRRVKRESPVNPDFAEFDLPHANTQPSAETVESETDKVARLNEYLKSTGELKGSETDASDDDLKGSSANVETQVIRILLRKRRNWTDSSRSAGDRELLPRYTEALLKYSPTAPKAETINVPSHSTFGQCWLNYITAIKNPFFSDWAREVDLDVSTVTVNSHNDSLSGKVKGIQTTFTRGDNSGWDNVAGPILRAVKVIDPAFNGVAYPSTPGVPLVLVSAFHGESLDSSRIQQRANDLNAQQAFAAIKADDPLRPLEQRSETAIENQKLRLGNLYTHHDLVANLMNLVKDKPDDAAVNLGDCLLSAHRDSSFAIKHPTEARRMVSAQRYISANNWNVPKNAGEVRNLAEVLTIVIPEGPERGNYRGALDSPPPPPTAAQQQTIRDTVNQLKKGYGSLLDYLLQDQAGSLDEALSSGRAKALGLTLEEKLDAISTPTSTAEWVMAALLLDIDATPGLPRNHVGGYNLTQDANWGEKPSAVIASLQSHLVTSGKASVKGAPAVARHLLASNAPEFLVRGMPDNLVCGSHTWTMLRIAVARIEQISPGAVKNMFFEQLMNYGETSPISIGEEVAVEMLSGEPLIDWAIANGVLQQKADDTYSLDQLKIATERFNAVRSELAKAQGYLTTPTPTRSDLALAELTRVFGKDVPFEELTLISKHTPQGVATMAYSIQDLYLTGQLTSGAWKSNNPKVDIRQIERKLALLKNPNDIFLPVFNKYFDNLVTGSVSIFKHLITQLPLDAQKSLEYGEQKYYSLRSQIDEPHARQNQQMIDDHMGRHGILIRSTFQGNKTDVEVFPDTLEIRIRTDLPMDLKLGGELKYSAPTATYQFATPQPFDWDAYSQGTSPRSGVTSNVIIEEITPKTERVERYPSGYNFDTVPNVFSANSNVNHIASVAVRDHFIVDREKLKALAKGVTSSEDEAQLKCGIRDFFLNLVPFKSGIDNISAGKSGDAVTDFLLDAAGFIPGVGLVAKIGKVAKSGATSAIKILKVTWISSRSLLTSANPLGGTVDLLRTGTNAICTLTTTAYSATREGISQLKKLYVGTGTVDAAQSLKRADVAEGSFIVAGKTSKTSAVLNGGKWYAFDVARNRGVGTPLENFKPSSSIPLERTTFSDGSSPLTPSRLFDTEPHTIQRSTGVDVVVGDKVYRFDPKHPEALEDIASPVYFKDLEGFESICNLGRSKRDASNCFSKIIDSSEKTIQERRAQSIEHKRLYPRSAEQGVDPRVVHERRIYRCNYDYTNCRPEELTVPLQFKATTKGSIIPNEHFGFSGRLVDNNLNAATRVVRVNDIMQGLADSREVRAFLVSGRAYGEQAYLVAEVDTGLFYYCKYDGRTTRDIEFIHIRPTDTGLGATLIKDYHSLKDPYIIAAGNLPNNDFIVLPTIDSLYVKLEGEKVLSDEELALFKNRGLRLTNEQQRDLVVTALNMKGVNFNVEVVIPAIKIDTIPKPLGFDRLAASNKNRLYAENANMQVLSQVEATGLGPFNRYIPGDPNDVQRVSLTEPVVLWEYSRWGKPDTVEVLLKTGAGNCDHMAKVAKDIIVKNGGSARVWHMKGHAFTMAGGPTGSVPSTRHFTEPAFDSAWIVDPWAGISCRARDYTTELSAKMATWKSESKMIITTDYSVTPAQTGWADPTGPQWSAAIDGPKTA